MLCKFCNKEGKNSNSLRNHERLCKFNPQRQKSPFENPLVHLHRIKSNQYLKGTAKPISEETRNKLRQHNKEYWTIERRTRLSLKKKEIMGAVVLAHPESYSYKNFCGRSKKSLYNDQWMHSSWELETAKWFDKHNIKWTRKVLPFEYIWDNKTKQYFPDFYLSELDLYVEVKGYETDRDRTKWAAISNLIVIKAKDIKAIKEDTFILWSGILRGRERPS